MSQAVTTSQGVVISTGQTYTDRRESNRRTLRVVRIEDPRHGDRPDDARVTLIVDLVDGQPPARPRNTMTTAGRLAGRDFILIEPPAVEPCACPSDRCGDPWNDGCRSGLDDEDTGDDECVDCGSPECVCPAKKVSRVDALCKHCHGPIHQDPNAGGNWVHSDGEQGGRHTCPVEPYGFHAEPVGAPCSDHPANPCNGARGIAVRLSETEESNRV